MTHAIKQAEECIAAFQGKRVAVIGDLMLDVYIKGSATRISPEAPVPILHVRQTESTLGGAANVMRNLMTLGAQVFAFGVVGNDVPGRMLCAELEKYHINKEFVLLDESRPTTQKQRVVAGQQQIVRIDYEDVQPIASDLGEKLTHALVNQIRQKCFDAVIIEDYAKGLLSFSMFNQIVSAANECGLVVSLDPHPKQTFHVPGLTVMTPNRAEAFGLANIPQSEVVNPPENDPQLLQVAEKIKADWKCENVLITLGAQGMALFSANEKCKIIPTRAREVFDVSGAGDTVIASFTLALLSGVTPYFAALFSNHAAGVVVGKHGTVTVLPEEILESFRRG